MIVLYIFSHWLLSARWTVCGSLSLGRRPTTGWRWVKQRPRDTFTKSSVRRVCSNLLWDSWISSGTVLIQVRVAFSSHAWIIGGRFDDSFPALVLLVFLVEIDCAHQFQSFKPRSVHIGSVNWDDCGHVFPEELHVSSFSWWVHTLCLQSQYSQVVRCR